MRVIYEDDIYTGCRGREMEFRQSLLKMLEEEGSLCTGYFTGIGYCTGFVSVIIPAFVPVKKFSSCENKGTFLKFLE